MAAVATGQEVCARVREHLLARIEEAPAQERPFSHVYLAEVFPWDVYDRLLAHLPPSELYTSASERHSDGEGHYVRWTFPLTTGNLEGLSADQQELFRGVAAALTAPEVKEALFAKLAKDLAYRYGIARSQAARLPGHARPMLYRETEGFEIAPHPDTRRKVVTMHLYLPADDSQVGLGTALYRRRLLASPFGTWHRRFVKVKQFPFRPNSGYAFVVNNTLTKKSWHGREKLPAGAGVRNTLLNTFYEERREGFGDYLG